MFNRGTYFCRFCCVPAYFYAISLGCGICGVFSAVQTFTEKETQFYSNLVIKTDP